MTKAADQHAFWAYRTQSKVLVAIMATICGPYGPMGQVNEHLYPKAWRRSLEIAMPLAMFCGQVALRQLEDGRDFFNEQPHPSKLYLVEPWPTVRQHPRTCMEVIDQCQTGARTRGWPHRKPTELWASDELILSEFRGLKCGALPEMCNGKHLPGGRRGEDLSRAQVWPWPFAQRLANGIIKLLAKRRWQGLHYFTESETSQFFPTTTPYTKETVPKGEEWRLCPGCRGRRP